MPTQKELNALLAKKIAESAFWNGEIFCRYFTDDFTMDIPTAPIGMPNHYSTWEAERCFEWLNRSVRRWNSEIIEFYPTPDPNLFFVHGKHSADVFWGEQDGHLESDYFMRIRFRNGKVEYLNWRFHTWAWLLAAGKRAHNHYLKPETEEKGNTDDYNKGFIIDLNDPDILDYMQNPIYSAGEPKGKKDETLDSSKEAINQRRQTNIYQFACGVDRDKYRYLESLSEDYHKGAFFTGEAYPSEENLEADMKNPAMFAWNKVCSPWMYRDPRNEFFPTDDPNVIFVEMHAHGPGCWRANGIKTGHYKQDYLVRLTLDDLGRLVSFEEIAAPVNGINSTGSDIDNFPYYH